MIWKPSKEEKENSNLAKLMKELDVNTYEELHKWSIKENEAFWEYVAKKVFKINFQNYTNIKKDKLWFPNAKLNCVETCFNANSNSTAIYFARTGFTEITKITYKELKEKVQQFASGFKKNGFKKGDKIALFMPMNIECIVAYLGTIYAGGVVVSIPDTLPLEQVKKRLEISKANTVITLQSWKRANKEIRPYEGVIKNLHQVKAIVVNESKNLRKKDISWDDFLGDPKEAELVLSKSNEAINILFSSGTTGEPKAIPWTQITPIKSASDGYFHQNIKTGDIIAWPTNIGWMMGPWLIFASFFNKGSIALFEGSPTSLEFLNFIKETKVSILGVVPALVKHWRNIEPNLHLPSVKIFSSTGEASNENDYSWLMERGNNSPVIEYCGGTETGGGYITGSLLQKQKAACFSTPAMGINFLILNEKNEECEEGEVFFTVDSLGLSKKLLNADNDILYYQGLPPGPNGEKLRRHGDFIKKLSKHSYQSLGRIDDTMNLGGIKVSSITLEQVINSHKLVKESAAISVKTSTEKLIFFIVTEKKVLDLENLKLELNALLKRKVNKLFFINELVLIDSIPRTASNKAMRRVLRFNYSKDRK